MILSGNYIFCAQAMKGLLFESYNSYITRAGLPAMAINGAVSIYCGPGGSARRLHQKRLSKTPCVQTWFIELVTFSDGGEPGSTCIESCMLFAR